MDAKSLAIAWADHKKREIDRIGRKQVERMADDMLWEFEAKPATSCVHREVKYTNVDCSGNLKVKGHGKYEKFIIAIQFAYCCKWESFAPSELEPEVFGARMTFVMSTGTDFSQAQSNQRMSDSTKNLMEFFGERTPEGLAYQHRVHLDSAMMESLRQVLLPAVESRMDVLDMLLSICTPFIESNGFRMPFPLRHVLLEEEMSEACIEVGEEEELEESLQKGMHNAMGGGSSCGGAKRCTGGAEVVANKGVAAGAQVHEDEKAEEVFQPRIRQKEALKQQKDAPLSKKELRKLKKMKRGAS
jgi:hypothetical protein